MAEPIFNEKTKSWSIRASTIDNYGIRHREYRSGFKTAEKALEWQETFKKEQAYTKSIALYDVFQQMMWEKEHLKHLKVKTLSSYEQYIGYLKKDIPNVPINELNSEHINKAIKKNVKYTRKCHWYKQLLTMVVTFAKSKNYVTNEFNPYETVTWSEYTPKETEFVYGEDLKRFISFCKENAPIIYAPVLLCGTYGLRPSEALCLETKDIKNNHLKIYKTLEETRRKKQNIKNIRESTKNTVSEEYTISEEFIQELSYFKNLYNIQSKYLCCNFDGDILLLHNFEKHFKNAVNKYNEQNKDNPLPNLTPYSLRHSFGNISKRNGTNLYTIKTLMRHKSIRTTEKNYLRSDDQLNNEAITGMTNALLNNPKKVTPKSVNILDIL